MALRVRPAFLRPIEIVTGVNDTFTMTISASPYTVTVKQGVYANCLTLLAQVAIDVVADTPATTCNAYLSDANSGKAVISFDATADVTTSALLKLLGFTTASYAGVTSISADLYPEHMWVPTYQSKELGRFYPDQKKLVYGVTAKDGSVVGRTSGPVLYYRDLEFYHESASNIFEETQNEDSEAQKRVLDYFARESLRSYPSKPNFPATRGFYYFPDINDATTASTWTDTTMAYNGIDADNTYVFCTFDIRAYGTPVSTVESSKDYYKVKFQIHTTSTSTWVTIS